jgi:hypothetical protein
MEVYADELWFQVQASACAPRVTLYVESAGVPRQVDQAEDSDGVHVDVGPGVNTLGFLIEAKLAEGYSYAALLPLSIKRTSGPLMDRHRKKQRTRFPYRCSSHHPRQAPASSARSWLVMARKALTIAYRSTSQASSISETHPSSRARMRAGVASAATGPIFVNPSVTAQRIVGSSTMACTSADTTPCSVPMLPSTTAACPRTPPSGSPNSVSIKAGTTPSFGPIRPSMPTISDRTLALSASLSACTRAGVTPSAPASSAHSASAAALRTSRRSSSRFSIAVRTFWSVVLGTNVAVPEVHAAQRIAMAQPRSRRRTLLFLLSLLSKNAIAIRISIALTNPPATTWPSQMPRGITTLASWRSRSPHIYVGITSGSCPWRARMAESIILKMSC